MIVLAKWIFRHCWLWFGSFLIDGWLRQASSHRCARRCARMTLKVNGGKRCEFLLLAGCKTTTLNTHISIQSAVVCHQLQAHYVFFVVLLAVQGGWTPHCFDSNICVVSRFSDEFVSVKLDVCSTFVVVSDVNECSATYTGRKCSALATCTNTPGSFSCRCNIGYEGDGFNCNGNNPILSFVETR